MYDGFLADFPDHTFAPEIEAALAQSLVNQAQEAGAQELPAPIRSGSTGTELTKVVIQNDAPTGMRIVFSGPETRVEELGACGSCVTYSGSGPSSCPAQGPIGRYTLAPGQYEVLVEDLDPSIRPWFGNWNLLKGDEYYSCFFNVITVEP
jgi:hypothetical protein